MKPKPKAVRNPDLEPEDNRTSAERMRTCVLRTDGTLGRRPAVGVGGSSRDHVGPHPGRAAAQRPGDRHPREPRRRRNGRGRQGVAEQGMTDYRNCDWCGSQVKLAETDLNAWSTVVRPPDPDLHFDAYECLVNRVRSDEPMSVDVDKGAPELEPIGPGHEARGRGKTA